jgi:hypothetical protein
MFTVIKLSKDLVEGAKRSASANHRTLSEQIEYWVRLGKAADENPSLPVDMLQDILVSIKDVRSGNLTAYRFS